MITVTLLAVLLAIAVPSFQQLILNQGVKTAAFDVFSAFEYTRSEAIKRPGETVRLRAGAASDGAWSTDGDCWMVRIPCLGAGRSPRTSR